jgi:hypothetical protein
LISSKPVSGPRDEAGLEKIQHPGSWAPRLLPVAVIVPIQPFKSSVVLLLQCAIENVRVDLQYFLSRHAISSRTPESNPLGPLWLNRISPSFKHRFTSCRKSLSHADTGLVSIRARITCGLFSREIPSRTSGVRFSNPLSRPHPGAHPNVLQTLRPSPEECRPRPSFLELRVANSDCGPSPVHLRP